MNELETKTLPILAEAKSISVTSKESFELATNLTKKIKSLAQEIKESFDPIIQKAHAAWKEAIARRDFHLVPLEETERLIKSNIGIYLERERRIQAHARMKTEEEARKKAEEERLQMAETLEKQGHKKAALDVLDKPLAVLVPQEAPFTKMDGVSSYTKYYAVVTDMEIFIKAVADGKAQIGLLEPNQSALDKFVNALGGKINIPGIRVESKEVVSVRR